MPLVQWQSGAVANLVITVAYLAISLAIVRPLVASKQWRTNRLGMATAAIFFTCAAHHGAHALHMLLPTVGIEEEHGLALRAAFHWHQVVWDGFGAVVAVYYWSLRRSYGLLPHGAKLFDDLEEKQRQALELNDQVVQGLVVAQMALEVDDRDATREALSATLARARAMIRNLLQDTASEGGRAGDLVRERAAVVVEVTGEDLVDRR